MPQSQNTAKKISAEHRRPPPKDRNKEDVRLVIMQREFTVACAPEQKRDLLEAAAHLDKQMKSVAKGNTIVAIDRCAVIAALNIAHELLLLQRRAEQQSAMADRLEQLHRRIDAAVSNLR